MSERRVGLGGPLNFRDLGGYPTGDGRSVRWGQVYRSDSLHHLTDLDGRRLHELGLRSALDFRAHDELVEVGIGRLGDLDIRHVHLPTTDRALHVMPRADWTPPNSAAEVYLTMMEHGARAYAGALHALADAETLPAVFFCMAGKDRTGVFSAVLLGVLGVADDDIVADYALTGDVIADIHARTRAATPSVEDVWRRLPADILDAHAATMEGLVGLVRDRWGSFDGYVDAIGVDAEVPARLRSLLTDAGPSGAGR
ncbi:MAG TPA: tyrosine-protein phosphatase [Acidimicrobiia bacterium]|nr:tyrosine-protein phosphatase [Acidimicrobiia bacterium]